MADKGTGTASSNNTTTATGDLDWVTDRTKEWKPTTMFFYGTLCSPELYKLITGQTNEPLFTPAYIKGWKVQMWGPYPAIVPHQGGTVYGFVYLCSERQHFDKLNLYETEQYAATKVDIMIPTCERQVERGVVFAWADPTDSDEDLHEGSFDLVAFLQRQEGHGPQLANAIADILRDQ